MPAKLGDTPDRHAKLESSRGLRRLYDYMAVTERVSTSAGAERSGATGDVVILTGYPIVFDSKSLDLGGFIEVVRPSAVDRALRDDADVVALANHNADRVLGRTGARTLSLKKDGRV